MKQMRFWLNFPLYHRGFSWDFCSLNAPITANVLCFSAKTGKSI